MAQLVSLRSAHRIAMFLSLMPAALIAATATPAAAEFEFDEYDLMIGTAVRQTVLTGFLFDGPMADLAVIRRDGDAPPHMRIYNNEENEWALAFESTLPDATTFVDIAHVGGRDRLLAYGRGQLSAYDPNSNAFSDLLKTQSSFTPPRSDEIPHVDISHDVNKDGRDDLVLPDKDGFHVLTQDQDGTFATSITLGPPVDLSPIYGAQGYRFDPWRFSRVHSIDFNRDGRSDLVWLDGQRFSVSLQDSEGRYSTDFKSFTSGQRFDTDRIHALTDAGMEGRVAHSFADLNGDAVGDLVVYVLEGKREKRKRSRFELFFGTAGNAGETVFPAKPDQTIQSNDYVQLSAEYLDLEGDGTNALLLTAIDRRFLEGTLWKELKGAFGDDVWLELQLFTPQDGVLPKNPNTIRRVPLDGVPSHREPGWAPLSMLLRGPTHAQRPKPDRWPRAFNATRLIGDMTGDGRADLVFGHHPQVMEFHAGVTDPDIFAVRSQTLDIAPTNDEEYAWLTDLNRDDKQDIVMHYTYRERDGHGTILHPPGTEPHTVRILIAR